MMKKCKAKRVIPNHHKEAKVEIEIKGLEIVLVLRSQEVKIEEGEVILQEIMMGIMLIKDMEGIRKNLETHQFDMMLVNIEIDMKIRTKLSMRSVTISTQVSAVIHTTVHVITVHTINDKKEVIQEIEIAIALMKVLTSNAEDTVGNGRINENNKLKIN